MKCIWNASIHSKSSSNDISLECKNVSAFDSISFSTLESVKSLSSQLSIKNVSDSLSRNRYKKPKGPYFTLLNYSECSEFVNFEEPYLTPQQSGILIIRPSLFKGEDLDYFKDVNSISLESHTDLKFKKESLDILDFLSLKQKTESISHSSFNVELITDARVISPSVASQFLKKWKEIVYNESRGGK